MINFKKVVSMVVMLSLILSACGKSPARRDVTMSEDGNNVAEHGKAVSTGGERKGTKVRGAEAGLIVSTVIDQY